MKRGPHSSGGQGGAPRVLVVATWALVALVVTGVLVHFAHTLFGFGSPEHDFLIEEWVYDFVTMSAAVLALGRAVVRRDDRLAWALIGSGLLLWAASDLYWTVYLGKLAEAAVPLGRRRRLPERLRIHPRRRRLPRRLARPPHVCAGLDRRRNRRPLRIAAIGTALLLDLVVDNSTGTGLEVAVAVAYPVLDLATLAVAAAALALTGWRPGRALVLVAAGVAVAGVGDAVYTYQSLARAPTTRPPGTTRCGRWRRC